MKIYYYTIGMGNNGGVVTASSLEEAFSKVKKAYSKVITDADTDISVWPGENDPYWDPKHPDVHERY